MKSVYPVIFTQISDKKNTVLIEVPDMNIYTEGYGMADAIDMARDAIGLHGITAEDMGNEVEEPSSIGSIDVSKGIFAKDGTGIVSMVDIDFKEYRRKVDNKSVRRNVTLPNWLNVEADKAHVNVSKVLQEALMAKLGMSSK